MSLYPAVVPLGHEDDEDAAKPAPEEEGQQRQGDQGGVRRRRMGLFQQRRSVPEDEHEREEGKTHQGSQHMPATLVGLRLPNVRVLDVDHRAGDVAARLVDDIPVYM